MASDAHLSVSLVLPEQTQHGHDAWTKLRLPGGTAGWVPDGTVELVAR